MKELSIEEKAKRYDEAIKRAKEYDFSLTGVCVGDIIEDVFPELKESENERIRKVLKEYFINSFQINGVAAICGVHIKDIIAWLEKQGEHPQGKSALEAANEEKVDNQNCVKPTDKVEPKFENGQWIVWQDKCYKVNYNGCGYELVDQKGLSTSLEYGTVDENAHIYDITKDAKDGDVLYLQKDGKEHIIIYKGVIKERFKTFVSAYCAYNGIVDAFCFADVSRYVDIAYRGIMPATKEQRDLLFQKMKEEGYEWDAEKKELKKIVQSSTEWSEEDERLFQIVIDVLDRQNHLGNISHTDLIACVRKLKSLRPKKQWKPSEEMLEALYRAIPENVMEISEDEMLLDKLYQGLKYGRVLSNK